MAARGARSAGFVSYPPGFQMFSTSITPPSGTRRPNPRCTINIEELCLSPPCPFAGLLGVFL